MASKKFLTPITLVNLASDPSSPVEGDIYYNTTSDTVKVYANGAWASIGSGGGSSTSSVYLVRNNTGSTILKGTLVSASAAEPSGRIDVEPFAAVGGINSELTVMGMATANISNGVNGEVISFGTLTGIDTRGDTSSAIAVGDETWAAGDILFAHPTVAGKLTNVRPQHDLAVAFITVRHASTGQIAVRIFPGNNHLEWMHDVTIDTPADNEVLAYDSSSGLWKNQTPAEAGLQSVVANVTDTEIGYLDGVTSSIQTQLTGKQDSNSTLTSLSSVGGTSGFFIRSGLNTVALDQTSYASLAGAIFTGGVTGTDLTLSGDLQVNGADITTTSTTFNIGNSNTAVSPTTNISTVATASGQTKTLNIGTAGASGSTTNINLGSAAGGTVTVNKDLVVSGNLTVDGTTTTVNSTTVNVQNAFVFEGLTANNFETTLTIVEPTADNTLTLPNATGTVALTSDLSTYAPLENPTFTGTVSLPALTSIGIITKDEIALLTGLTENVQYRLTSLTTSVGTINTDLGSKADLISGTLNPAQLPAEAATTSYVSTNFQASNSKNIANGYAGLDASGKVLATYLDLSTVAPLGSPTFTGIVVLPSTTSIGTVDSTEISYLDGVTSAIQTQIDTKLGSATASSTYLTITAATEGYQPLDGDLTAIAALTGTSGFLKKAGTNTWTLDDSTYLTTASASSTYFTIDSAAGKAPTISPTFTGTVVLPSTTSIGDVSSTEISYLDGVTSSIQTQIGSKASSGHTHSYQDADSDLTAIAAITSGVGLLKRLGPDTWSIDTNAYITGSSPTISTSLIAGTSTFNLINSIATTVNFAGAATTLIMGSTDAGASTTIRTPAITTTSTSLDLFNTTATTVNFAGAATTFNLGGTPTGSLTATLFGNATTTTKTINIGTGGASGSETNINIGSSTSGATGTVSVYPSTNFVGTVTVPTPTSSGHATTKGYVDALAAGITVKAQVVYVSSANLNATYANGTSDSSGGLGVGATLTGNVDGALILDGPEVEAGQRVLIKNQTDAKHNGIYVVTFAGDGDDPFILTRATDFNGNTSTNGIINNGAYIFVTSGTSSANDSYVVSLGGTSTTPSGAIKIGTDNIVLAQYSGVPNNISTLGYVTTGTWAATPIDKDFIDTEIARTNDPVFTGHVTVPSPTDDTDAANKEYVDDLIFASLPYLPDIIPLDDLRYEFNGMDSRFVPKFQGEQVAINNPLRLLVTINGIIQTVDFPEYVWQSMLPREGFMVDNDGYIAFSEVVPVGSTFDARVMLGPNVNSIKKGYPFRAVDILLGA
jgi:hypothetical protein